MMRWGIDDDLMVDLGDKEVEALEKIYGRLPDDVVKPDAAAAKPAADAAGHKAPAKPAAPAAAAAPGASPSAGDLQAQLAARDRELAAERRLRAEAEAKARGTEANLAVVSADKIAADFHQLKSAKAATDKDIEAARGRHKAALESGDYEAAGKASEDIADLKIKANLFHEGMVELEGRHRLAADQARKMMEPAGPGAGAGAAGAGAGADTGAARAAAEPAREQTKEEKVDAFIATLGGREQAWAKAHRDVFLDERRNLKLTGLHNLALADGIQPGTDAYFERLDRGLGFVADEPAADAGRDGGNQDEREVIVDMGSGNGSGRGADAGKDRGDDRRRAADADEPARRVSAPVTRGGVDAGGNGGKMQVRLSKAEVEMAELMGISQKEYAQNKLAMQMDRRARGQAA